MSTMTDQTTPDDVDDDPERLAQLSDEAWALGDMRRADQLRRRALRTTLAVRDAMGPVVSLVPNEARLPLLDQESLLLERLVSPARGGWPLAGEVAGLLDRYAGLVAALVR